MAVVLAAALTFSMVACGGDTTSGNETPSTSGTETPSTGNTETPSTGGTTTTGGTNDGTKRRLRGQTALFYDAGHLLCTGGAKGVGRNAQPLLRQVA